MPNRSQVVVWGTINLASLLFRAFNLDDFPASIGATGRTNTMGWFRTMALGTIVQRRRGKTKMAAPLALTRLSIFPFR
jgi:hypothetical protein